MPDTDQPSLRDRIADALAKADGWEWADGFDKTRSPSFQGYQRQADAVLAVLPTPVDGIDWKAKYELEHARHVEVVRTLIADPAAVLRGAADEIDACASAFTAEARKDPLAFIKGSTDARYRTADCWNAAAAELRRMADDAQQPEDAGR